MALRNQPYLPLYVKDFLTNESLAECSAESTGVYIRLMCLMHKSQEYGVILLKQKDKQTGKQISDFALKLARQMPYEVEIVERSLSELIEEDVLTVDGDKLIQRRMVKDEKLSNIRALAGSKGGKTHAISSKPNDSFAMAKSQANPKAKVQANTAIANVYEYEDGDDIKVTGKGVKGENPAKPKKRGFTLPIFEEIKAYCKERGNDVDPQKFYDYFTAAEWVDSRGNPVKNWKQKVITWESHERRPQGGQHTGNNQQTAGEDAAGDWNLDGITVL